MYAGTTNRVRTAAILAVALVALLAGGTPGHAQTSDSKIVSEWNALAIAVPMGPLEAMGYTTLMHIAIYDAVVTVEGGYEPFAYQGARNPNASAEAAAATAAHRAVLALLPGLTADANALYATHMAAIPDGAAKTAGVAIGEGAAAAAVALPLASQMTPGVPYTPRVQPGPDGKLPPGAWEPTSPSPPIATWAPNATPLTFANASQFRPGPPPALDSAEWVAAFNEVRDYGGSTSTVRTQEQADTALYYSEQPAHQPHKSFRRFIAERNLDLVDSSRFMAMVSTGITDAIIACFDAKYYYQFWRPIQSVPGDDGNPATAQDPNWTILIAGTPNHPEYPAAHSCATSTWSLLTAHFLGTDQINFTGETLVDGRQPRFWPTVQDALFDVANGRIWGGVHYRFSTETGAALAKNVADNIIANYFQPTNDPVSPAPMPPSTGTGEATPGIPLAGQAAVLAAVSVVLAATWVIARRRRQAS